MVGVALSIQFHGQHDITESWRFLRPDIDLGTSVLQRDGAFCVCFQQVIAHGIGHLAVSGYSVFIELYFYVCLLAGLVQPVGMVGYGYP